MIAFIVIAATACALATVIAAVWLGFRNGDFTGEALARSLRKDLEEAAADSDRIPPAV